ncbi:MAG: hypothetical protein J1G02_00545 [Clostridiales bacterium]|nr:hypothetical protein [Clostridiales bacterium]
MKKLLCISIILLFIFVAIIPAVVFAASSTAEDIVYFLNPTAITAMGDSLFIADRIEENKSVIMRYDVTESEPILSEIFEVDGCITNLAQKDNGLYAVFTDKIVEYSTSFNALNSWSIANPIDVVYGTYGSDKTEYVLKSDGLLRPGTGGNTINFTNGISCIAIGDSLMYAYKQGNSTYYGEFDGKNTVYPSNYSISNSNSNAQLTSLALKGMFIWNDKTALFTADTVGYIVVGEVSCEYASLLEYDEDCDIIDATAQGSNLYLLNDNNQIEVFVQNELGNFDKTATIGNDELNQKEPTVSEFKSFTLVNSLGYPTNIVFKTTGGNSIDNIITDATEYIVIGYDGEQNSNFYYVLIGDKFGWVKKSDNTTDVNNDEGLAVIDTSVSGNGFSYKAKFVSLNAVYVSTLPRLAYYDNESYRVTYQQSSNNKLEVSVLQRFDEGEIAWYYVSFLYDGQTCYGFVRDKDIKMYITFGNDSDVEVIGNRKINTPLFSSVKVYNNGNPATMTEENYAYDTEGKQLKLSAGTRVTLISVDDNGVAFIQIKKSNYYGYVYADNLIETGAITTNATVGLILLAVAIALVITLTIVYLRRMKRRREVIGE